MILVAAAALAGQAGRRNQAASSHLRSEEGGARGDECVAGRHDWSSVCVGVVDLAFGFCVFYRLTCRYYEQRECECVCFRRGRCSDPVAGLIGEVEYPKGQRWVLFSGKSSSRTDRATFWFRSFYGVLVLAVIGP